ncbi:MAG: hypothetical protein RLZZ606_1053, partial [Actinomycetota bacterium]
APKLADLCTRELSSSAVLEELNSSLGSIPRDLTIAFPVLFKSQTSQPKIKLKASWNLTTALFTGNGSEIARFLGISSPTRKENTVANTNDRASEIPSRVLSSKFKKARAGSRILASEGSARKPVSIVVTVIPIWALERCVLERFRALMLGESPRSP